MKTFTLSVLIVLVLSTFGMSQSIGVFGGYLNSSFDDQEDAAGAIELGASFVIDALPILDAGAEYTMTVSPFEFEGSDPFIGDFKTKLNSSMFGVYARYNLPLPALTPYVRVGAGYYSGSIEVEALGQTGEEDFSSALGFNVGAGINTFTGLNAEFVYHLVKRELDQQGAVSAGYNYWGLRVGYYFSLL
jgi:hypothetical protein